ncbi:MAG: HEAT repeat domain-containing protein, partial [Candidatus Sumerlaeota bacterium]|nr:HEAT repeat domain-containing protein [Candidatus Sumerlaeota bacterium]
MKLYSIARLLVAAFAAGAISLMAQAQDIADLTKELTGEKTAAQRAPDQMEAAYSKAIDSLLPDLGDDDPGKRGKAQVTLEQIAFNSSRPGAEAQRAACSKAIAAKLGADVPPLTSVWLIRQLERIGRAEAVDALAKALGGKDAQIRECARRALLKNSSAEAAEALRKTMAVASDSAWRIALINAMASRRDPADLAALLKEAASDADDVRIAAMVGLAKIGDKSAAPSLAAAMAKGSPEAKRVAADCHLLLADALSNKGEQAEALGIYKSMLSSQGYLKCGAIIGVGRAGGAGDLTTILQAMPDADARLRGACIDAMVLLKGKDVTEALCAKTKAAEPEMKLALFKALVRRADKTALPTFVSAAEDANEDLCVEAIRGLGAVGDASVTPLLLKIAANSGKPQDTARASLERLKGDDVDKALIAGIDEKDAKIRVEAIRALAGRRTAAAAPALLKSAEEADANVRGE